MKNDGGPAFPCGAVYDPSREIIERMDAYVDLGGMSLRDWFAGQALAGLIASNPDAMYGVAQEAYSFADAMLDAREKSNGIPRE